ncbi:MAG: C13 family peptidase [Gammaproteobacteria bacterium]
MTQRDGLAQRGTSPAHALLGNLIAGAKLAFALPVEAREIRASAGQLVAALLLAWLAAALGQRLATGADARLWAWGVMVFAGQVHFWLAAVGATCWVAGRGERLRHAVVMLVYAAAPVTAFAAAFAHLAGSLGLAPEVARSAYFRAALLAWHALLAWRVLGLFGVRWLRAAPAIALYAGALAGITLALPAASMFYRPQAEAAPLDVESIYYRQPRLLARQIDGLEPQAPGRIDLYFVGLGAFASEDVFRRELMGARTIVADRLGAGGRSLVLVNHPDTVDRLPLANLPNLRAALAGLAGVIDPAEDIVFLFLTSHGYEDASLAAEFGALRPNDLYADGVRDALDAAGIRWRVVVVSACFSGSFIGALATPHTLVMTAAAADRPSFGCRPENDWTYFGQAYFDHALGRTDDPVEAFYLARAEIERREAAEGKPASRPQIHVGELIAGRLAARRSEATQSSDSTKRP